MYFTNPSTVVFSLLASSSLVAGHGAITGAVGNAGGKGSAIGINPATPRNGTTRNPFQQDSTRFRGANKATCGQTIGGGENDIQNGTAKVLQQNGGVLPQITAGGQIKMTVHQVNADGAGSYKCMIDATGTGTNWQPINVTQNLPGNAQGRNTATQKSDQPLVASIPADQTCTGTVAGQKNVCMVRCENPARAGPFGGCVPVQMTNAAKAPAASGAAKSGNTGDAAGANKPCDNAPAVSSVAKAAPTVSSVAKAAPTAAAKSGNAGAAGNANNKPCANGPAARKRQELTADDQEEEIDLLY